MTIVLKILRIILLLVLGFVVVVTSIFIIDKYVFNPHMKGISPVDIRHVLLYLILPLTILIFGIRVIEKKRRKASSQQRV